MSNSLVRYSLFSSAIAGSALVLTSITLFAIPASAGDATANLSVSATVANNCTISTTPLNFGSYEPSANLDITGTVTTTCTNGASATIMLGEGLNPGGGSTPTDPKRRLKDGGSNYLSYYLYKDNGHSDLWGDTTGTGLGINGTGSPEIETVYGRIPFGQNPVAGTYSDTVVATVQF